MHHLPAFRINPGPNKRAPWQSIACEGGSEPGVLNLSPFLVAHDTMPHGVGAAWNGDKPLDEERLTAPLRTLQRAAATANP